MLLDFAPTPNKAVDFASYWAGQRLLNSLPNQFLEYLLGRVLPNDILEKLIFLFIFIGAPAVLFYSLPRRLGILPPLLGGIFYICNPFVWERFLAGHIHFLLGYVFLPLAVFGIIRAFSSGRPKDIVIAALWWTVCAVFSVHYFLILTLVFLVVLVVFLTASSQRKEAAISALKIAGFVILFNSFWLIPALFLSVGTLSAAGAEYFQAYRTAADVRYGLATNILGLYGFWRERTASPGEMYLAKIALEFWPYILGLFWILMPVGIGTMWRAGKKRLAVIIAITGALAVFLAAGSTNSWVGEINNWFYLHLPGFKIMREAQKWLVLLVFCYSVLIAWGFYLLQVVHPFYCSSLSRTTQQTSRFSRGTSGSTRRITFLVMTIVFLVAICLYNYTMFWGANGKIQPVQYPASWLKAKEIIQNDSDDYRILVLPWHLYVIDHPLAPGRTTVDPAHQFFYPARVLASTNESVAGIQHQNSAEENQIKILLNHPEPALWQKELQKMNIKYIFVSRNTGGLTPIVYQALKTSDQFELLVEDEYAGLLQVKEMPESSSEGGL